MHIHQWVKSIVKCYAGRAMGWHYASRNNCCNICCTRIEWRLAGSCESSSKFWGFHQAAPITLKLSRRVRCRVRFIESDNEAGIIEYWSCYHRDASNREVCLDQRRARRQTIPTALVGRRVAVHVDNMQAAFLDLTVKHSFCHCLDKNLKAIGRYE